MLADQAIQRLVIDEDEQTGARHILKPVAATVDPTPRSLKGYLMAYSMLRAVRTAEGSTRADAAAAIMDCRGLALADAWRPPAAREARALCARQFRELRHLFLLPSTSYFR